MHIHFDFIRGYIVTDNNTGAQWLSGRVLKTKGPRVRASTATLRCVLEQDTFILA